jgi:hypothetical protein
VQSQASPEDLANRMSDRQRLKEIDVARIVALLDPRVPLPGRDPT